MVRLAAFADSLLATPGRRTRSAGAATALCAVALAAGAWGKWPAVVGVAFLAWVACLATMVLRCGRARWGTIGLVLAAEGVYGLYLRHTPFNLRNFDAPNHLKYIQFIVQQHALPRAQDCGVCHHPPAYHLLAAPIYALLERTGLAEPSRGLQGLSVLLFMVFVVGAVLTIHRLCGRPYQQYLATALVAFWPYNIINSVRVNNDTLLYAVAAAALYGMVRWQQHPRTRWLLLASGCTLLGVFTKSNGALLIGVMALLVAVRLRTPWSRRAAFTTGVPAVGLLVLVASLHGFFRGSEGHDLVRNTLGTAFRERGVDMVQRTARYYLTFQPRAMVRKTYAEVDLFAAREPTYWNHLLKSSLYGTVQGDARTGSMVPREALVRPMNWLVMALGCVLLLGIGLVRKSQRPRVLLSAAVAAILLSGGVAFHLLVPALHHADFRFSIPALIPLAVLYAHAAEGLRSRLAAAVWVPVGLACVFLALSVASLTLLVPQPPRDRQGPGMLFRPMPPMQWRGSPEP